MKKIMSQVFIFTSAFLFLGSVMPQKIDTGTLFAEFDYIVSFYSSTKIDDEFLSVDNAGSFFIITCNKERERETELRLGNVLGRSYKLKSTEFDLQKFISKYDFKIEITQDLQSGKIMYLYSNKLYGEKTINGRRINLQIAVAGDYIIAASPIILGAF